MRVQKSHLTKTYDSFLLWILIWQKLERHGAWRHIVVNLKFFIYKEGPLGHKSQDKALINFINNLQNEGRGSNANWKKNFNNRWHWFFW